MRTIICKTRSFSRLLPAVLLLPFTAALSFHAAAQPSRAAGDDLDKMVEYAQCIRENGYPEFPDPSLDGRFQMRLNPGSASKFQAARQACADKVPSGLAMLGQENPDPERMEALLGFAACMRASGIAGFPDPSPKGAFEVNRSKLNLRTQQVQRAMESCRETHPVPGGIRIGG